MDEFRTLGCDLKSHQLNPIKNERVGIVKTLAIVSICYQIGYNETPYPFYSKMSKRLLDIFVRNSTTFCRWD